MVVKVCQYCGKEYESKNKKYCSASCRSKATFEAKREIFAKTSKLKNRLIDLTGKKFGKLTVIKRVADRNKQAYWLCKCECGNEKIIAGYALRDGRKVKSCGCTTVSHGKVITKHYETKTRLYRIWQDMKSRCYNKKEPAYKWYGARGITICKDWENYFAFKEWSLANGYTDNLTIDRIDVNGNYEPSNCRWATRKEQANNTRTTRHITYKGETYSVSEWTRILGFKSSTLSGRLNTLGWSIEKAFNTPIRQY